MTDLTLPEKIDAAPPGVRPVKMQKPERPEPDQQAADVGPTTEIDGFTATDDLPDFGDRFAAGWDQRTVEADVFDYKARLELEATRDMFDALPAEAQQRLKARGYGVDTNPAAGGARNAKFRRHLYAEIRAIRDLGPEGDPAFGKAPLSEEEFQDQINAQRRAEYEEANRIQSINGGGVAGFLGGLSRDIVDPVNIGLAPFGVSGGIVRTFAAETVLGGVAAGLSLPREYAVADELDLPRPDALTRIGTEALASGVLGAGFVALIRGAQAFKVRRRARKDGKPEAVSSVTHEDAVIEAEARLRDELPAQPSRRADGEEFTPPDFDFSVAGNASPRTNRVGYVFGKFLESGMEPHIAAGFVGNFMVESGAGINTRAIGDGGAAHGMAQWNDRRHALFDFARRQGKDWQDIDVQIEFVLHELATSEAGAWARIRRATTAAEAAELISRHYERPGIPHMDRRIGYAQGVIDQYEGGQVPQGGASAPSSYVPQTTRAGYTSQGQVRTAAGTRIDVEYEVVDASVLTRASGDLQPRDRSLGNSDEQVANIAATLDPALLMPAATADRGAPIVGPDNVVESGNGRFAAIQRAADKHPDRMDAYRQQIEAAGFDVPDDVRTPVLIGRRTSELSDAARRRFVVEAQDSGVARMTPIERSRAEAATLDPDTLSRLNTARGLDDLSNADFVRAALERLPRSERNAFVTPDGRLNADGRKALERALFARAFNDPELLARFTEQDAAELKSLLDALFEASPAWARLVADVADGSVRPEFDITGHVLEAMRMISGARRIAQQEGLRTGSVLSELLDDVDLLEGAVSPLTRALVGKFWRKGRAAPKDEISGFLTRYADEARKVGQAGDDLLGQAPDVPDVLRAIDPEAFADLAEIGAARGQSGAVQSDVSDTMPEGSFAEGALSRDAEEVDGQAAEDLRAALDVQTQGALRDVDDPVAIEEDLKQSQPIETIDDLYDLAPEAQAWLGDVGSTIARDTGAEWKDPGIKERATAEEKMQRKRYSSPRSMTDVARGGFVVGSAGEADAVVRGLARAADVLDQGWNVMPQGYMDRKVLVRTPGGIVAEVQIWSREMLDAKVSRGTDLYTRYRSSRDPAEQAELFAEQVRLYSAARDASDPSFENVAGTSNSPKVLANIDFRASADGTTGAVVDTSPASTGSQVPPRSSRASASGGATENRTAGRPSQLQNIGDVMGDTSGSNISSRMGVGNTLRDELLADGDFMVPIEGGEISARELLDDIEADQQLDEVVQICLLGGGDA